LYHINLRNKSGREIWVIIIRNKNIHTQQTHTYCLNNLIILHLERTREKQKWTVHYHSPKAGGTLTLVEGTQAKINELTWPSSHSHNGRTQTDHPVHVPSSGTASSVLALHWNIQINPNQWILFYNRTVSSRIVF
jgi:hypothetical protein